MYSCCEFEPHQVLHSASLMRLLLQSIALLTSIRLHNDAATQPRGSEVKEAAVTVAVQQLLAGSDWLGSSDSDGVCPEGGAGVGGAGVVQ